jgi:hypothetical protein
VKRSLRRYRCAARRLASGIEEESHTLSILSKETARFDEEDDKEDHEDDPWYVRRERPDDNLGDATMGLETAHGDADAPSTAAMKDFIPA